MNITHGNKRNNINTYATQNNSKTQPYDDRMMETANSNVRNFNLASKLNILNIKSIYYFTIINELFKDNRFIKIFDHEYNIRRRAQGRYKVKQFFNEYEISQYVLKYRCIL